MTEVTEFSPKSRQGRHSKRRAEKRVSQETPYENSVLPKISNPIAVADLPAFLEHIGDKLKDEFEVIISHMYVIGGAKLNPVKRSLSDMFLA